MWANATVITQQDIDELLRRYSREDVVRWLKVWGDSGCIIEGEA
ncbi:MAG: hypothetical protein UY92_C0009G0006 [Candidatus Magasanikbacteria bacterium GW2011_GWA2_56_11]|uniref:Uncharacterized protein n=1 Tax=Candidatus Magasanikbacteria bacterium GW2011_GWA2_56_11 TaxID=1619044 RepID=A0A0G2B9S0_9BACT|nr:MAG: hypothetical protein UY92_C0009G0006 [Candidatus Magasanikbacteria bacterium GW2011_GWA2_56_11]